MQARPFVVVLTGGPCSGKSSALALLRDRLTARGLQALTVPENATHFLANSDGFQPEWAGTDSQVKMQRIFLDFQIAQEEAFKSFASLHPTKRPILLLDCCTINSKVYVSDEQWEKVLASGEEKWTEEALFARYDLVVHMATCALEGHYEWGPGSNNPGRYHTPEQAKEQDVRCLEVFRRHPQLRVVPHCPSFKEKIEKVAEFVNDALHIEGLSGKRRRRACEVSMDASLEAMLGQDTTSASLVSSCFVDDGMRHSVRRSAKVTGQVWLELLKSWQKHWADPAYPPVNESSVEAVVSSKATNFLYERRDQVVTPIGQSYLTRKVMNQADYFLALESRAGKKTSSATKLVLRFLHGSQYYELFFFLGRKDLILDFSAEVAGEEDVPSFLTLQGGDLSKQDWAFSGAGQGPASKKPRVLRAHSTEEAAFFSR
eukprot:TRINITY_DN108410_c0_g1_i1.p1 TRINITY_DN108410_c0_g1~~TRINITY_DN108410_c0_g1_i1.p1  ORF type:complete len:430 (-),score=88.01 TRINITY_DN108410_c0_g1_i1:71-1360(-)